MAYLGFQKGGAKCLPATSGHTKGRGHTKFSNFFYYVKKKFLPKGGHGQFGQGVNTPLHRSNLGKKCLLFESPYVLDVVPVDNISLSRKVFEIFYFEHTFKSLTLKSHRSEKNSNDQI